MRVLFSGVSRFHGAAAVLSDVSLAVPAGARVGVVGPNGVGKSTLLRIAAGLEAPDAGRVEREPRCADRRLPAAGARPAAGRDAARAARPPHRRRRGGARPRRPPPPRLAEGGDDADGAYDEALERFLALGGGDLDRRAAAMARTLGLGVDLDRPGRGPVRRRGGARRAGRHPPLAVRPARAGRADERPRLRRPRPAGALPRRVSGRAARRLARPRVPRPHGRAGRRDRPDHAAPRASSPAAGRPTRSAATPSTPPPGPASASPTAAAGT